VKSEIIQKIIQFFENREEVIAVYIFGSYARGKEQIGSDIDLAILLNNDFISQKNALTKKYSLGLVRNLRKDFHIVIMNKAGEQIICQVFKYGKCILNRQPGLLNLFKMISYSMIVEFYYHRNIMQKGFVRRITGEKF